MSVFREMFRDWPFLLFLATFVFGFLSLVFGDLILLGIGIGCAVIAIILEKKVRKE